MMLIDESKLRLMWMMVMFDLPVVEENDRKQATKFRSHLMDLGFEMAQFSVYFRFCGTREGTEKFVRAIRASLPTEGNVSILFFTDRQFSEIINIQNKKTMKNPEKADQYMLF